MTIYVANDLTANLLNQIAETTRDMYRALTDAQWAAAGLKTCMDNGQGVFAHQANPIAKAGNDLATLTTKRATLIEMLLRMSGGDKDVRAAIEAAGMAHAEPVYFDAK